MRVGNGHLLVLMLFCFPLSTTAEAELFEPSVEYGVSGDPLSIAIGDLDGDSFPDLAVANYTSGNFSVIINSRATVSADLACLPPSGTLPFATQMTATLSNLYTGQLRRMAARIHLTLGGGGYFASWRAGFTNVSPGGNRIVTWNQDLPDIGSVVGDNTFQMVAEDVTPSPFNQSPYPPSGATAWATCTITGVAP